ncbi:MAG: hypothetical protein GY804_09985 [Alphaproteobacteria bacterium]|nr:hypothetical protein [Alphaproteobacteria bacterium]
MKKKKENPNEVNLFGEEQKYLEIQKKGHLGKIQMLKKRMGYRKTPLKNDTCKFCVHRRHKDYHNKPYNKCELIGDSNCEATDIKILNYTCDEFERINES